MHLHSTYSDGTGTVPQIARAAGQAGVDVVLLTDHDTLAARRNGEERWYGDVLLLVGHEVTPPGGDHYLAFGLDQEISRHQTGVEIRRAVEAAGGFGFGAHPFSRGSERFKRPGIPWEQTDALDGIELWSFLNDTAEKVRGFADVARMIFTPQRIIGAPPEGNLREWDRLCRARRVVAIGGLDAHQFGIRVAGHVPLRAMGYRRTFRQLHTHLLLDAPLAHELDADRERVYEALREGRCYIANDLVADATGFSFEALDEGGQRTALGAERAFGDGITLHASTPQPAHIRLLCDGALVAERDGRELSAPAGAPGVYRVEAEAHERPWIYSNPVYLRV